MLIVGSYVYALKGERTIDECSDIDAIANFYEIIQWLKNMQDSGKLIQHGHNHLLGKWIAKIKLDCGKTKMVEFEVAMPESTGQELMDLNSDKNEYECPYMGTVHLATDVSQLALKTSHRYLKNSPYFWKTMLDIKKLREVAFIPEHYEDWLARREKETYNYSHPSLMKKKADFFNGDAVKYIYDHDELHLVVKLQDVPAYEYFKADDAEVYCDKDKFFDMPYELRINSVLEECWVLALERSQIPYAGKITPFESFKKALEKVCTSIASGWWREFAWENVDYILMRGQLLNDQYYGKFLQAVRSGAIKPRIQ